MASAALPLKHLSITITLHCLHPTHMNILDIPTIFNPLSKLNTGALGIYLPASLPTLPQQLLMLKCFHIVLQTLPLSLPKSTLHL